MILHGRRSHGYAVIFSRPQDCVRKLVCVVSKLVSAAQKMDARGTVTIISIRQELTLATTRVLYRNRATPWTLRNRAAVCQTGECYKHGLQVRMPGTQPPSKLRSEVQLGSAPVPALGVVPGAARGTAQLKGSGLLKPRECPDLNPIR